MSARACTREEVEAALPERYKVDPLTLLGREIDDAHVQLVAVMGEGFQEAFQGMSDDNQEAFLYSVLNRLSAAQEAYATVLIDYTANRAEMGELREFARRSRMEGMIDGVTAARAATGTPEAQRTGT